jgi:hypothetical protein
MAIPRFNTQKELKKNIREIIDKIGACDSVKLKHPEYVPVFYNLFNRHPDYPSKFIGLTDIRIGYNPVFRENLEVYIIKNNGDIENVSVLNHCITGKPKDNLKMAMRVSIHPQIEEYKNNNTPVCELCRKHEKIEIDHHSEKSPFAKLYNEFMNTNKLTIPNSFDDTKSHMKCFKKMDEKFKENWIKYHKEHAILRMLCKSCNGSQSKYKMNSPH